MLLPPPAAPPVRAGQGHEPPLQSPRSVNTTMLTFNTKSNGLCGRVTDCKFGHQPQAAQPSQQACELPNRGLFMQIPAIKFINLWCFRNDELYKYLTPYRWFELSPFRIVSHGPAHGNGSTPGSTYLPFSTSSPG